MTTTLNLLLWLPLCFLLGGLSGLAVFRSMRLLRISQLERELEEMKANNRELRQMYEDACAFGGGRRKLFSEDVW